MPSPGSQQITAQSPGRATNVTPSGLELLREARERERQGPLAAAIECYQQAIAVAERSGAPAVLSEGLRRLAVLHQQRDESTLAQELCERSYRVAREGTNHALAAEALNTLGGIHLTRGSLPEARGVFLQALDLGASCRELRARVTQNLGILANIQGHLDEALAQYQQSLQAYREAGDRHGCAIAYHNLGMVSADRGLLDEAGYYFHRSRTLARREGDVYLQALALVSQAEVDVARQRYENARQQAEEALVLFDSLGTPGAKADPYRVLGMV
ncbi:MAG TPA: tetratricopeptide repeat protein, partial [Gemmatimonadales bacterium]|nr:tetratricopeptide repeat protein [Gemmatimonadales bacterium]